MLEDLPISFLLLYKNWGKQSQTIPPTISTKEITLSQPKQPSNNIHIDPDADEINYIIYLIIVLFL